MGLFGDMVGSMKSINMLPIIGNNQGRINIFGARVLPVRGPPFASAGPPFYENLRDFHIQIYYFASKSILLLHYIYIYIIAGADPEIRARGG